MAVTKAGFAGAMNRLWAAFPPARTMSPEDKQVALQTYWEAIERSSWLTDDLLVEASRQIIASTDRGFPSVRRLLDWCVEAEREQEREVDRRPVETKAIASQTLAMLAGPVAGSAPDGLKRFVASGQWDRWWAYGSAKQRLRREPTTEEVDSRLREIQVEDANGTLYQRPGEKKQKRLHQLRGPIEAAFACRITTESGHVI